MGMPEIAPAPAATAPLPDQIRAWHRMILSGGSVRMELGTYQAALVLAVMRDINGLGADHTDPDGDRAMADVTAALADY